MEQLMVIGRTVWGPKVPTLKGTEVSLSYVQCFLYLVSSSVNVSIFHISWLDTFWTDHVSPTIHDFTNVLCANFIPITFLHHVAWPSCPHAWGQEWSVISLGVPPRVPQQCFALTEHSINICPNRKTKTKTKTPYMNSLGKRESTEKLP